LFAEFNGNVLRKLALGVIYHFIAVRNGGKVKMGNSRLLRVKESLAKNSMKRLLNKLRFNQ
jgi:hypothetical protein